MNRPQYDRINVWHETLDLYKDSPVKQSIIFKTPLTDTKLEFPWTKRENTITTKISFYNEDCIDVAVQKKQIGNPLMLNMASWTNAGGGVSGGAVAQEEECFRRSNYFKHLHQSNYPLGPLDTILSKGVEYKFGFGTQNSRDIKVFAGTGNDEKWKWTQGDLPRIHTKLRGILALINIKKYENNLNGTIELGRDIIGVINETLVLGLLIYHQLKYTDELEAEYEI